MVESSWMGEEQGKRTSRELILFVEKRTLWIESLTLVFNWLNTHFYWMMSLHKRVVWKIFIFKANKTQPFILQKKSIENNLCVFIYLIFKHHKTVYRYNKQIVFNEHHHRNSPHNYNRVEIVFEFYIILWIYEYVVWPIARKVTPLWPNQNAIIAVKFITLTAFMLWRVCVHEYKCEYIHSYSQSVCVRVLFLYFTFTVAVGRYSSFPFSLFLFFSASFLLYPTLSSAISIIHQNTMLNKVSVWMVFRFSMYTGFPHVQYICIYLYFMSKYV